LPANWEFTYKHLEAKPANAGEGLLVEDHSCLEKDQLPQPWLAKLVDETQPIGSYWKGASSKYLRLLPRTIANAIIAFIDSQELLGFRSRTWIRLISIRRRRGISVAVHDFCC